MKKASDIEPDWITDTSSNYTAAVSVGRVSIRMITTATVDRRSDHREGILAKTIEEQTAKLPSETFLWPATGSIAASLTLKFMGRHKDALFVGQWAPTFLILGLYNKLVKQLGSDRGKTSFRADEMRGKCCVSLGGDGWPFDIARVLVRFDHVVRFIVKANHRAMSSTTKRGVSDALRIAFGSPYQRRPNGSASEIKLTPVYLYAEAGSRKRAAQLSTR